MWRVKAIGTALICTALWYGLYKAVLMVGQRLGWGNLVVGAVLVGMFTYYTVGCYDRFRPDKEEK